ncbi:MULTISPECIES: Holliday junction resolvase RuvX [Rheinheimera]|jgi:putative Holliday junction resolvase|uniref:Holliday junction resolvase RuvX n=1 Tax=Rheinheimera TaxID=67575 RepID=UPI0008D60751|nr:MULTISPECIES: Holliday junction resolvase RuvX [Rheinheimera]MBU0912011.1 Holliday junction resolvase RuvX [Gammaproteobacteria bacterium]MBY0416697.1 Holliday junction resolvase RuvX [Rheinheimera sp.]OGO75072.1 MAG: Holliday junction DNA helicase RuvA [Chromatiales bacterium RIFOXYA1_FULL_46_5]MDF3126111.1 Holliday junction resolvase RuvX [Rheinheimera sp. 1928-s]CAI3800639.1 Putative pre-16S rRNA nuclease [Rheinheimera sp. MM224]
MSSSVTVLAFDYGLKSIGVAVGQSMTGTATMLKALKAQDGIPNWDLIEALIKEWQPKLLVVGLPLNMDGTEQPFTARVHKFVNRLHGRYGLQVKTQDERLTTVDARSQLFAEGGFKKLSKELVDSLSAKLILESWFENGGAYGD